MIPLRDNLSCKVFPIATLIIILLNCVGWGIQLSLANNEVREFFMTYAVVPQKVTHAFTSGDPALIGAAVLSILTSMFLHGSWMHLIGNMIFLQAFGRAVEARFGALRFVAFYLLGGVIAWGFHFVTDPMSQIPALGASGAIAAVLGGYLLFYPKSEFRTLVLIGFIPILVTIRAYWLLPVWFVTQLIPGITGLMSTASGGGVAYWAHIGGFVAGLALAAVWQIIRPQSDVCYKPLQCDCQADCAKHRRFRFWED